MKSATHFIHEGWSLASYIKYPFDSQCQNELLEGSGSQIPLERTPDEGVRRLASPLILGLPGSFDFLM